MKYPLTKQWRAIFTPDTLLRIKQCGTDVEKTLELVGNSLEAISIQAKKSKAFKANKAYFDKYILSIEQKKEQASTWELQCFIVLTDLNQILTEITTKEAPHIRPLLVEYNILMLVPAVIHFYKKRHGLKRDA